MRSRKAVLLLAATACGGHESVGSLFSEGGLDGGPGTSSATSGITTAEDDATAGGSQGTGTTAGGTVDDSGTDAAEGAIFDVPAGDEGGPLESCGGNGGCINDGWSYVWIANSQQSTVSKVNTRTLVEEGRYLTRADAAGNPSRTSVSVDAKAVAVANRHTGVVKIWAQEEFCEDQNGVAGIQTSTGKSDVLAWGEDDCVAWYTPFDDMSVQRPIQWTPGVGPDHTEQKIWTVTGMGGDGPGQCGPYGVWVHRLDGDTGVVEDTVFIDEATFPCDHTGMEPDPPGELALGLGAYGGAVDFEGNFWFHGWGTNTLARVDFATLEVETFDGGGYGITVDTKGRVWLSSSIQRFDYALGQWQSQNVSTSGGIAQDLEGRIWAAGDNGVVWVDMETLAVGDEVALPGAGQVKGVSVDVDGCIWAIRQGDPNAYRIHPTTYAIHSYTGLDGPYTYSDMTGGQITNVTCNPPEG